MAALFHQHADYDFRIASRCIPDKPGVVPEFLVTFAVAGLCVFSDNLRCAGFTAKLNSFETRGSRSPSFVHHVVHSLGYLFHRIVRKFHAALSHIWRVLQKMRLFEISAGSNAANHVSKLNRGSCNRSLTDGDRDCFARIPFAVKHALHPGFRWHQTRLLRRKIDPGFRPKPQQSGVPRDSIYSHALSYGIEKHVARMDDRLLYGDLAVPSLPIAIALEHAAIPRRVAGAKHLEALWRNLLLKHCRGHHDLENRPWR